MLEKKVVFVLGAGASCEYGFPLGEGLKESVTEGLQTGANLKRDLLGVGFLEHTLDQFRERLRDAGGRSIDFFLEGLEPELISIGKIAIAHTILHAENMCREHAWLTRKPPEDDWLGYVWGMMRPGLKRGTLASEVRDHVSFVTFNYDRVLEQYFETVLGANFGLNSASAKKLRADAIEVIHLHGALADTIAFGDFRNPMPGTMLADAGEGLVLINDDSGPIEERLKAAKSRMKNADLVCLLGFGFHPKNTERLELGALQGHTVVYATSLGLGRTATSVANRAINKPFLASPKKAAALLREDVDLA